jgi:hypothetical protein
MGEKVGVASDDAGPLRVLMKDLPAQLLGDPKAFGGPQALDPRRPVQILGVASGTEVSRHARQT